MNPVLFISNLYRFDEVHKNPAFVEEVSISLSLSRYFM